MERIVIVAYQPFPGKIETLVKLVRSHWDILNKEGLVSSRKPIIAQAKDGSIIEIFGWESESAIDEAHSNKVVQDLWAEFATVCDYSSIASIPESKELFSEFSPL